MELIKQFIEKGNDIWSLCFFIVKFFFNCSIIFLSLILIIKYFVEATSIYCFLDLKEPYYKQIRFRKIGIGIGIILLVVYIILWVLPQYKQLLPLYTPFRRSVELLPTLSAVSSNLPNVRIILGDYEGHETKVASSLSVWATIMVSGSDKKVVGLVDWGDGVEDRIPIRNGLNSLSHSYSSPGTKGVNLRLQDEDDGQILGIASSDGIPRKEITAEIKIPKGGSDL